MFLTKHWSRLRVVRRGGRQLRLRAWGVAGVSSCCAGNLQPWLWVLTKTATFGWLFNARAASFEQNTVHRCARSPNQNHGVWGYGGVILYPNAFDEAKSMGESDTSGRSDGRHFSPRGNGSGISVFTGESAKRQVNPRAALTTKICVSIVVFKGYKG